MCVQVAHTRIHLYTSAPWAPGYTSYVAAKQIAPPGRPTALPQPPSPPNQAAHFQPSSNVPPGENIFPSLLSAPLNLLCFFLPSSSPELFLSMRQHCPSQTLGNNILSLIDDHPRFDFSQIVLLVLLLLLLISCLLFVSFYLGCSP